jgi:hypothetical protein
MTKTLNQIIFFFPPPKSEYFFQQYWESEYFLEKNHNPPPFKLNGRSLSRKLDKPTNYQLIKQLLGLIKPKGLNRMAKIG